MLSWSLSIIPYFFNLLFFFVPLVLFPKTSELFEFNKMILTYTLTILIVASWLMRMVSEKRVIFRRTILNIPLLIFLLSLFLSTVTSIDIRTSIFGYYSRFHGGFLSLLSYSLLYWAFVSNMDKKRVIKSIYVLLASAVLVSIYGVFERLGIDKDIWIQDVQNRVFSTLGQPNWLAAWLVALTPVTWALALNSKFKMQNAKLQLKIQNYWIWVGLSALFFLTLLYTKSRSGIIGFTVSYLVFWIPTYAINTFNKKQVIAFKKLNLSFGLITLTIILITLLTGTPWTPTVQELINKRPGGTLPPTTEHRPQTTAPALEVGGTESGEIRKIVWKGAADIWKNYPILGTGVETFAFSYYNFRPSEHNLVSEWDYLYNKAHNEYLNYAATTGSVGLTAYLFLIVAVFVSFLKKIPNSRFSAKGGPVSGWQIPNNSQNPKSKIQNNLTFDIWSLSLMSGFASILVTNFFGFSVVPVALLFFLYPAMALSLGQESKRSREREYKGLSSPQILGLIIISSCTLLLFYSISKYWYADYLYARGKLENDSGNYTTAQKILQKAIKLSSKEAIFWDELSQSSTEIALALYENGDTEAAERLAGSAITESGKAVGLSPANVNLKRNRTRLFIKLSAININYLIRARDMLIEAVQQAPTDAKLYYNLALAYVRTGNPGKAIGILEKTIEMKKNYREARFALALLLMDEGKNEEARGQLEYILENINPNDIQVRQELEEIY